MFSSELLPAISSIFWAVPQAEKFVACAAAASAEAHERGEQRDLHSSFRIFTPFPTCSSCGSQRTSLLVPMTLRGRCRPDYGGGRQMRREAGTPAKRMLAYLTCAGCGDGQSRRAHYREARYPWRRSRGNHGATSSSGSARRLSSCARRGYGSFWPADADRSAIEGDLHDSVQQHLVALAVKLQLAGPLVDSNPGGREGAARRDGAGRASRRWTKRHGWLSGSTHSVRGRRARRRAPLGGGERRHPCLGRRRSRLDLRARDPARRSTSAGSRRSSSARGNARATATVREENGALEVRIPWQVANGRGSKDYATGSRRSAAGSRSSRMAERGTYVSGSLPVSS